MKLAHVSYVLSTEEQVAHAGMDWEFLFSPFQDPANIALMVATAAALGAILFAFANFPALVEIVRYFRGRTRQYTEFIPFILRAAAGVALIGAGSEHFLVSPALTTGVSALATIEMLAGFLLLIGFLITPAALAALALVIGAMIVHPTLIGNLDLLATLIAALMLGQARPGADDLLGIQMAQIPEKYRAWTPTVLRFGLGIACIYLSFTEKFLNPHHFAAVVENYSMTSLVNVSPAMWTFSVGFLEFLVGLVLILGWRTRTVSIIGFITLSLTFFIFKEEVYAHVTLMAAMATLILTGAGPLSIDQRYAKR